MLNADIAGKKLLLIGGINNTADLVELAHRNGVQLGVADYNKGTLLKRLADYSYDVNAYDEDAMADLVQSEGYDGIITAFNERLGPVVSRLGERVGMPVPFSVEQYKMSTNKKYFKHTCQKYGVPVPREWIISSREEVDSADIEFPVIVKPVDNASSVGVMPCFTREELRFGYDRAAANSKAGDVIVEQYLPYDEINVTYIAQDGNIQLAAIHDRYFNEEQESYTKAPDLYIYPSRYTEMYLAHYDQLVVNMLQAIRVKNGSLFIQAIVHEGKVYFYEAGMRLNGCKTYQILEYENDYNTFEHLILYALTGSMGETVAFDPNFKRWYATLNVLGEPGATIDRYSGDKALETYPWLIHIAKRYCEGDTIPPDSAGTLVQDTTRIHLLADSKEELIRRIDRANMLYKLLDPTGRNIVLRPHDTAEVLAGLDYDLHAGGAR